MTIKLDMEKAFDLMKWPFILKILSLLGVHSKWINWIEQPITTTSFSILLNGTSYGKFRPSRGLRQRDSVSSFLFIIGFEFISRLIFREESLNNLHGIKISRNGPPISHDIMIFCCANPKEAYYILACLNKYSAHSNQMVNLIKFGILYSRNSSQEVQQAVDDILQLSRMKPKAKYLGLPLLVKHNKKKSFEDIKNRILNRGSGWKAKALAQAAGTTLIKSVASAIPNFTMSMFLLPKTFCRSCWKMIIFLLNALKNKYLKNKNMMSSKSNPQAYSLWKEITNMIKYLFLFVV